jgi:HK97 family phage portal protein
VASFRQDIFLLEAVSVGVFSGERMPAGQRENRALTFIQPLIGAHLQALTDQTAGDIDSSLRQQTVWNCVGLLASSLAMMPPYAYRGGGVQGFGEANRVTNQPVLLNEPSADADIMDFLYIGMMSLLLRGNLYGIIADRDSAGRPAQIEIQHPDQMHVKQLENGTVEYRLRNKLQNSADVWHKRAFRMPGKVVGLSPIEYAARTIRLTENAKSFGSRFFEDGGHPSGLITNESTDLKQINQDDAVTIKQRFMAAVRGSREPVVMGGGWKYQQIQISPDESQFLNTQKWSATDICRAFWVKPEMVGAASEGSAITYANVENRMLDFLTHPLGWWLVRWERWLGKELAGPQYVKFDTRMLLKTDMLSRLRGYHMMIGSRAFTQDEVRAMEDMPPLTAEQRAEIDRMPEQPLIPGPKVGE